MTDANLTIAIKGAYGFGNFGDDVLMVAASEIAKKIFTTQSIVLLCNEASYIQKLLPDARVVLPNSRYGEFVDIVLYGGGTQFYSFPLTSQKFIASLMYRIARNARRPIRLGKKVFRKMMEVSSPIPNPRVAAIGIGIGPFVDNYSQLTRTKRLFTQMDYIAVRDIYSYNLCKEWGCSNVRLRADLCYLPDMWKTYVLGSRLNTTGDIRKVGVLIRDWPHSHEGDSYMFPLFKVVEQLRSIGKKVDFISFAGRSDVEWAKRFENKREQSIEWDPGKDSISSFLELLSGYDAFITARYHGAVFASMLRKPVVCIEIEQKLSLVSKLLGNGARLWTYPFDVRECLRHVFDLENDYSRCVECLALVVEEQGALVEKMICEVSEVFTPEFYNRCARIKLGYPRKPDIPLKRTFSVPKHSRQHVGEQQ